ncbi:hypothetical protein STEG23_012960, partial [Scotinomys teguina]
LQSDLQLAVRILVNSNLQLSNMDNRNLGWTPIAEDFLYLGQRTQVVQARTDLKSLSYGISSLVPENIM